MSVEVVDIQVPCQDPVRLARFWSEVLGRPRVHRAGGVGVPLTAGSGSLVLLFTDRPDPRAASAGAAFTLTLAAEGRSLLEEVARLEGLGGVVRQKRHRGGGVGTVVLADPEGNAFRLEPSAEEAERRLLSPEGWAEAEAFWDDAQTPPSGDGRTTAEVSVDPR